MRSLVFGLKRGMLPIVDLGRKTSSQYCRFHIYIYLMIRHLGRHFLEITLQSLHLFNTDGLVV